MVFTMVFAALNIALCESWTSRNFIQWESANQHEVSCKIVSFKNVLQLSQIKKQFTGQSKNINKTYPTQTCFGSIDWSFTFTR